MTKNKELDKKLQSDPSFMPFNNNFNYDNILNYIKKNKNEFENLNPVTKALSTFIFNIYYKEFKENINHKVEEVNLSKEVLCEILIDLTNRDTYLVKLKSEDYLHTVKGDFHFEDLMNVNVNSDFKELGSFNLEGIIEAKHDALNTILNYLLNYQNESDNNKLENDILSCAYQMLGHANLYSVVKFAYDTAIWENYYILYEGGPELKIKTSDRELSIIERIGEQRLDKNILSSKILTESNYSKKGEFYNIVSKKMKSKRKLKRLKSVLKNKNYLHYKLADGIDNKSISCELMLFAELTSYYNFLGDELLPNFENLSLHDIITIFSEIQNLLNHAFDLKKDEGEDFEHTIDLYKTYILRTELQEYLFQKLYYSKKQINIVIGLLSHEEGFFNIWQKPLIRRRDIIIPIFLPAISPNSLRLLDYWLEAGGFDLESRGKIFENHIKSVIKYEINKKGYFINIPTPSVFRNLKNDYEEIDLIIELKTIIIVSEVKCIKFPFEPRDFHNMLKRLKDGATQAKRKTKFLKDNFSEFSEHFRGDTKEIIPLVITNYPIYSGLKIENTPIIDYYLLEHYIVQGAFNKTPVRYDGKTIHKSNIHDEIIYYNNEDQFSNNLKDFLIDPIPVRELRSKIVIEEKLLTPGDCSPKIIMDYTKIDNSPII